MSATTRVSRVCGLLLRDTPYRPNKRQVRRVLAVLPQPAHPLARRALEQFAAIVVALPYRINRALGAPDDPPPFAEREMMPCRVDGPPTPEELAEQNGPRAMLCALASALERGGQIDGWLDQVDWQEAGVTRAWFAAWWQRHKLDDTMRREREQAQRDQAEARRTALGKLSPQERASLGLR